jgi:uncharacterized membrane protein SpoIIM required for sporulation
MKESKFIEQNKKNWQEFESDLRYKRNTATKLSRLFIQITDDLSFVRTFYKHRSVKIYLNGIAQYLFNDLYRNQTSNFKGFVKFWKFDLPMLIHDSKKEFRISFVVFLLAFSIGILSSLYDKDFARIILGDEYVKMTTENIKNNDPMAVYKKAHEADMFFGITINNLMVALSTFLLGVFLSIGSIFILIKNGVMVGAFQYFFIERGLFRESFLTIWQHGTLEISSIIIAGAAGITLGRGLIFPGTYSRMESFKISALQGLKIFLGIAPIIVIAAFIEGFLTRHTELSAGIRISVIAFSLFFILFYFVWYPWFLSKKHAGIQYFKEKPGYKETWKLDFSRILSAAEILGYTFKFITQRIFWVIMVIAGISAFHSIGAVIDVSILNDNDFFGTRHTLSSFFKADGAQFQFLLGIISVSFLQCLIFIRNRNLLQHSEKSTKLRFLRIVNLVAASIVSTLLIIFPFKLGIFWGIVTMLFFSPILFLVVFQSFEENVFFLAVIPRTRILMQKSWGKLYWNSIKIFIFLLILYLLFNTPLIWKYIENIYESFNYSPKALYYIDLFIYTFIVVVLFSVYFLFQTMTAVYSYYAFRETVYAEDLNKRINKFGERNILFGFEKEL